ncbi:MAG TPA: hypothetical protein PLC40_03715 [Candidatus Hydrogenedentes bacterium]|nr:MAG: hypothetical protein BWY09_00788 [Candidatus Hydrogenedentes bacterium ADurb.Bin179]HOH28761.1 hypothetical protein [Candidatus Hydrogenedentota bacterium]
MTEMTPEQWKAYAAQWQKAGPELERIRRAELANTPYNARAVDALLEIGASLPHKEEKPNGLVEMQRLFMKMARQQGLLPTEVSEENVSYGEEHAKDVRESGDND